MHAALGGPILCGSIVVSDPLPDLLVVHQQALKSVATRSLTESALQLGENEPKVVEVWSPALK